MEWGSVSCVMAGLKSEIIEILDKAKTSILHHPKLLKSLKTLHDENELEEFLEAFISPFRAALLIEKAPAVERVFEFAAKFAASVTPLDPALESDEDDIGKKLPMLAPLTLALRDKRTVYARHCILMVQVMQ